MEMEPRLFADRLPVQRQGRRPVGGRATAVGLRGGSRASGYVGILADRSAIRREAGGVVSLRGASSAIRWIRTKPWPASRRRMKSSILDKIDCQPVESCIRAAGISWTFLLSAPNALRAAQGSKLDVVVSPIGPVNADFAIYGPKRVLLQWVMVDLRGAQFPRESW